MLAIISGAVQLLLIYLPLQLRRRIFHIGQNCNPRWLPVYLADTMKQLESQHAKVHQEFVAENHFISRDDQTFSWVLADTTLEKST